MSVQAALQKAIFDALIADADVQAIVEARIFDGMPPEAAYPCVTFGPSDTSFDDMDGVDGRIEAVQLDCWVESDRRMRPAKELADAVKAALHLQALALDTHALANLQVTGMRVFMEGEGRLIGHGVVQLEALVEER